MTNQEKYNKLKQRKARLKLQIASLEVQLGKKYEKIQDVTKEINIIMDKKLEVEQYIVVGIEEVKMLLLECIISFLAGYGLVSLYYDIKKIVGR